MKIQLYPSVKDLYQEMYRQATLHPKFKYNASKADRKLICAYIVWLNKRYKPQHINDALLIRYFEFQFSRYSGIITPKGKNNIMLNWVIGPKAIKEWETRNVKKRWLVRWRIQKDFKLQLSKYRVKEKEQQLRTNILRQYEERDKQRFYQTGEGYVYCGQMTTLYNPISPLCGSCRFKAECTERLQLTYPDLYARRTTYSI